MLSHTRDGLAPLLTEPDGVARVSRQSWLLLAFITLLSVLSLLDRNIIALFLDDIKAHLDLTDVQASIVYGGAFAITFSVMGLPLGWAVDRLSRRNVIFAGVSIWSIATVACGLVGSFPTMVAARAFVGAGEAALVPSAQSIISDTFPAQRRTLPFSIYGMGQKIGAGFALVVGGALAAIYTPHFEYVMPGGLVLLGWQLILILVGAPGIAIALLIFAFREPPRSAIASASGNYGYRRYLAFMAQRWRYFVGHHLGFVIAQSVIVAIMSWTPSFFIRVHGWTSAEAGVWFGTVILVGPLLGMPLHGWFCDRLYSRGIKDAHMRYQLMILPLSLLPLIAGYLVSDAMLALAAIGTGMTIIVGSGASAIASMQLVVSGEQRGKAASIQMLIGGLAAFLGPSGVALFNQTLFSGQASLGRSMALFILLASLVACGMFQLARLGLARMDRAQHA